MVYVIISYLSLLVFGLSDNVRGPLYPEILKAWQLNNSVGALYFILTSGFLSLGALISPWFLKRLNCLQWLRLGLLLMALGYVGFATARNFFVFLLGAAVFGVGLGILGVAQNLLVVQSTSLAGRARALSGLHCFYSLASWLAPLQVTAIGVLNQPLQNQFWAVTLEILFFLLMTLGVSQPALFDSPKEESGQGGRLGFLFAVGVALYLVAEVLLSSRLVQYLREVLTFDASKANFLLSLFFLSMAVSRLIFSFIPLKISSSALLKVSLVGSLVGLSFGQIGFSWGFLVAGLFMAPFFPTAVNYMSLMFESKMPTVFAWAQGLGSLFIVIAHGLVGIFTDWWGVKSFLYVVCAVVVLCLLSFFVLEKKQEKVGFL